MLSRVATTRDVVQWFRRSQRTPSDTTRYQATAARPLTSFVMWSRVAEKATRTARSANPRFHHGRNNAWIENASVTHNGKVGRRRSVAHVFLSGKRRKPVQRSD